MSKTFKIFLGVMAGIIFALVLSWAQNADAADYTIDRLSIKKSIYFDRNYDGWGGTGSEIYDNNNLVITSDDFVEIWAPAAGRFRNEANWRRNYDGWHMTYSRIYDDNNMHVATDDFLFLDAPVKTIVQNHMDVNGTLQVFGLTVTNAPAVVYSGMTIAAGQTLDVLGTANINNLNVTGSLSFPSLHLTGTLTVDGLSSLDGGIDVNDNFTVDTSGNTWIGGTLVVDNTAWFQSNIDVDGTAEFDGDVYVDGVLYLGDLYTDNIYPNADATYDIGSGALRYNEIYLDESGGLYVGDYAGGNYMAYDNNGVNSYGSYSTYIWSDNDVEIAPTGDTFLYPGSGNTYSYTILPDSDSTYDLGASGNEWANGYFDNLYVTTYFDVAASNFSVDSSGNTYAAGTLTVDGTSWFQSNIDVDGWAEFDDGITVSNNAYFQSNIDVDGIGYFDNDVYANNIYPNLDSTYDLGASGLEWDDLYVDYVTNSGALTLNPTTSLYLYPGSGMTYSYSILPDLNATYSLGSLGLEWLDAYIDTVYAYDLRPKGASNIGYEDEEWTNAWIDYTNTYQLIPKYNYGPVPSVGIGTAIDESFYYGYFQNMYVYGGLFDFNGTTFDAHASGKIDIDSADTGYDAISIEAPNGGIDITAGDGDLDLYSSETLNVTGDDDVNITANTTDVNITGNANLYLNTNTDDIVGTSADDIWFNAADIFEVDAISIDMDSISTTTIDAGNDIQATAVNNIDLLSNSGNIDITATVGTVTINSNGASGWTNDSGNLTFQTTTSGGIYNYVADNYNYYIGAGGSLPPLPGGFGGDSIGLAAEWNILAAAGNSFILHTGNDIRLYADSELTGYAYGGNMGFYVTDNGLTDNYNYTVTVGSATPIPSADGNDIEFLAEDDILGTASDDIVWNAGDNFIANAEDIYLSATDVFDADGNRVRIDSGTYFSIDGLAASNVSVTGDNLAIETLSSGDLYLTSANDIIGYAANDINLDAGNNYTMDSVGTANMTSTGASGWANDNGTLTFHATTFGPIVSTVDNGSYNVTVADLNGDDTYNYYLAVGNSLPGLPGAFSGNDAGFNIEKNFLVGTGGDVRMYANDDIRLMAASQISLDTTSGSDDIIFSSGDEILGTAATNISLTATTGTANISSNGASGWTNDSGALSFATTTSGSVFINSADDFDITTADDMLLTIGDDYVANITGLWDVNVTEAATLDSTTAGISLDGVTASNFTVTGASQDLTLSSIGGSVNIQGTEAVANAVLIEALNGGIDVNAGLFGFDLDTTGQVNIDSSQASANAIRINASNANGGIDVDSLLGGMTFDTTGAISLNAVNHSDFTVTGAGQDLDLFSTNGSVRVVGSENVADAVNIYAPSGGIDVTADLFDLDLTATTTDVNITGYVNVDMQATSGNITGISFIDTLLFAGNEFDATSLGLMDLNAGANMDIDVTGTYDMLSSGAFSIDGTGASNVSATSGQLTLSTITSGDILLDPAGGTVWVDGNLLPNVLSPNTYDLGSPLYEWNNGYIDNVYAYNLLPKPGASAIGDLLNEWDVSYIDEMYAYIMYDKDDLLPGPIPTWYVDPSSISAVNHLDVRGTIYNTTGDVTIADSLNQTGGGQVTFSGNVDATNGLDVTGANLTVATVADFNGSVDADVTTFEVDASGTISLDSAVASNFSTAAGLLTLSGGGGVTVTSTGGTLTLNTTGQTMDMDAATFDVDGGTFNLDTTGAISLDAGAASNFTTTAGNLSLEAQSTNGQQIILDAYNAVNNNTGGIVSYVGTGGYDLNIANGGVFAIDGGLTAIGSNGASGVYANGDKDLYVVDIFEVAGSSYLSGNVELGNAPGDNIDVKGTPTFFTAVTFNNLANLNGGIAVDATNFTVDGSTGATAINSTAKTGTLLFVAPTPGASTGALYGQVIDMTPISGGDFTRVALTIYGDRDGVTGGKSVAIDVQGAVDYGLNFASGTFNNAEIRLKNGNTITNGAAGTVTIDATTFQVAPNATITPSSAGTLSVLSNGANAMTVDSGTTGDVNLGSGNNAKTVNIANGTAANTVNIATDNTVADTINIGSASDTVNIAGTIALSGNLDMNNNLILNIGAAGTDFTAGGGLNLAGALDVNNSVYLGDGGDTITIGTVTDDVAITDANWSVTGAGVAGFTQLNVDNITIDGNQITSSTGTIDFNDDNLTTTGTITSGSSITIDGTNETISATDAMLIQTTANNGDITLNANGTGVINFSDNANATAGLDVTNAALTFDNALTQSGAGQVTFTGNVDATAGLDVTGANFTAFGGYGSGGTTIRADAFETDDPIYTSDGTAPNRYTLGMWAQSAGSVGSYIESTRAANPADLYLNTDYDGNIIIGSGTFTQQAGGGQVTFTGNVDATSGLDISGGNLTLGANNITGVGSITATTLTDGTASMSAGALTGVASIDTIGVSATGLTAAGAFTIQSTAAALTLDTSAANTINIGNTNANAIALGNAGAATTITQTGAGQVAFNGNVNANLGLDVSGAAFTFTGTAGSWTMALADSAFTQTGTGLVTFTGNVDATNGLDVTGALTVTTTIDVDGTANIADTTAGSNVTMGNSTGNLTFISDDADFTLTDATDNVFQLMNSAGGNPLFNIDLGVTDAITLGNNATTVAIDSSVWDITSAGVASGFTGITSTGTVDFSGAALLIHQSAASGAAVTSATTPSEICNAANLGRLEFVDETDNANNAYLWVCGQNGAGYSWKRIQ